MKQRSVPISFIEELLVKCPPEHFLAIRVAGIQYEVKQIYFGAVHLLKMDGFKPGSGKVIEATNIEMINYWYVPRST